MQKHRAQHTRSSQTATTFKVYFVEVYHRGYYVSDEAALVPESGPLEGLHSWEEASPATTKTLHLDCLRLAGLCRHGAFKCLEDGAGFTAYVEAVPGRRHRR